MVGDGGVRVAGVASLERAGPGDLSFLVSSRYLPYFQRTSAGAVLLPPEFGDVATGPATRIVVAQPAQALARVVGALHPEAVSRWGIHPSAHLGSGVRWSGRIAVERGAILGARARFGTDCRIGPGAVVGDGATVGNQCRLGPGSVIYPGAVLGDRVVLQAGACVGSPGFGFTQIEGGYRRHPHIGRCIVKDDVEIGAHTTIDRGLLDDTVVGEGTKIDNLVQIGHNVRIGNRCLIMAQVGIGGSAVIGNDVILAGQAGLADHVTIGRGARVAAQSGVIGHIEAGETVSGYPARSHLAVLRQTAALARLAPLTNRLERLVQRDD